MYATVRTQAHRLARGVLHCLHTGGVIGLPISFEYNLYNTVKYYQFIVSCVESCVNNPVFNIWQWHPSILGSIPICFANNPRPCQITSYRCVFSHSEGIPHSVKRACSISLSKESIAIQDSMLT